MITAERVRQVLGYNPATGVFTWKVRTSNRVLVGSVAGCRRKDGYIIIWVDKKLYLAHRLAWLYVTGEWPSKMIDHKDNDPGNNRIDNLRDVTQAVNTLNVKGPRVDNTSGYLGVSAAGNRWVAQLGRNGWRAFFDTPEEAAQAYQARKQELLPS